MFKSWKHPAADLAELTVIALPDGREATLRVRRSARARRLAIRILPTSGTAELVLPKRASMRQGIAFAKDRADWLQEHLAQLPPPIPFADGAIVPPARTPEQLKKIFLTDYERWETVVRKAGLKPEN